MAFAIRLNIEIFVSFSHIIQVSLRSNSHVINLRVFNRHRFALIMLFPVCTNDKSVCMCMCVCVCVCVCAKVCT